MMLENFCNFVRYSNSMVIKTHPYFSEIHIEAGRKLHDIHVMICYITLQEIKRTDEAYRASKILTVRSRWWCWVFVVCCITPYVSLCIKKKREKDMLQKLSLSRNTCQVNFHCPFTLSLKSVSENRQRSRTGLLTPSTHNSQGPLILLRPAKPLWTPTCPDTGMSPSSKENPLPRQTHAPANHLLLLSLTPYPNPGPSC